MEKVRLGIIGVGNMGMPVSKLIAFEGECPELEVTAICDISEERRNWATNTFAEKNVKIFADAEEMMTSGLIDAVYIATPHPFHKPCAELFLNAKKHVLCEKPMCINAYQAEKLNRQIQLCLYSLLDIAIHYDGADYSKVKNFLDSMGIKDENSCRAVYEYIVEEPANYLKYYLGYLEILDLKEKASKEWGEDYTDYEFHQFFLDAGPSDFRTLGNLLYKK